MWNSRVHITSRAAYFQVTIKLTNERLSTREKYKGTTLTGTYFLPDQLSSVTALGEIAILDHKVTHIRRCRCRYGGIKLQPLIESKQRDEEVRKKVQGNDW